MAPMEFCGLPCPPMHEAFIKSSDICTVHESILPGDLVRFVASDDSAIPSSPPSESSGKQLKVIQQDIALSKPSVSRASTNGKDMAAERSVSVKEKLDCKGPIEAGVTDTAKQSSSNTNDSFEAKLERSKRKLHEDYSKVKQHKMRRTIQVLGFEEAVKQQMKTSMIGSRQKNSSQRRKPTFRQRLLGKAKGKTSAVF